MSRLINYIGRESDKWEVQKEVFTFEVNAA